MLTLHRTLVLGALALMLLSQIRMGAATTPPPLMPQGFVEVIGPHGIPVLIGPLLVTPTGGYEREVIVPGQSPFYVSTEPGVTPQDIANTYG